MVIRVELQLHGRELSGVVHELVLVHLVVEERHHARVKFSIENNGEAARAVKWEDLVIGHQLQEPVVAVHVWDHLVAVLGREQIALVLRYFEIILFTYLIPLLNLSSVLQYTMLQQKPFVSFSNWLIS